METDIDKEHADHAQQQAADARHLHGTRQVEPLPQVGNLRRLHRRRVLHVLFLQGAHQLGIGQETVGIGQHIISDMAENSKAGVVKSISIRMMLNYIYPSR